MVFLPLVFLLTCCVVLLGSHYSSASTVLLVGALPYTYDAGVSANLSVNIITSVGSGTGGAVLVQFLSAQSVTQWSTLQHVTLSTPVLLQPAITGGSRYVNVYSLNGPMLVNIAVNVSASSTPSAPPTCAAGTVASGNECLLCGLGSTSFSQSTSCNVRCAPTNFAVGLQGLSQHRVELQMQSTSSLSAYDANSDFSDFTMAAWVMPTLTNITQYIASKDGSWYVQIQNTSQLAVKLVPWMPYFWVTTGVTLPLNQWTHVAVTAQHSFTYGTADFTQQGTAVPANPPPTYAAAAGQGGYLRDVFTIIVYLNGSYTAGSTFQYRGTASTSYISRSGDSYGSSVTFNTVTPVVAGQSVNVGACMAYLLNVTQYLQYPLPSGSDISAHWPCVLLSFIDGSYTSPAAQGPTMFMDGLNVLSAGVDFYTAYAAFLATQYVVDFEAGQTYQAASVLTASNASYWTTQANSRISPLYPGYPFMQPGSPLYGDFINQGFFNGLVDEFALFSSALTYQQIGVLAYQPIISPTLQVLDARVASAMSSLLALLQFEEWLGLTTGTVGTAMLVSSTGNITDASSIPTVYQSGPLHVNYGPLCYPLNGAPAGSQPTYATSQQTRPFSPMSLPLLSACPAQTSNWAGSTYCFACPIGYTSVAGGVCTLCPTGTYNTAPGTACTGVLPSGSATQNLTGLAADLTASGAFVYGVYIIGLLPGEIQAVAVTTATPGAGSPPAAISPVVPVAPIPQLPPLVNETLIQLYAIQGPLTPAAAAVLNLTWAVAALQTVVDPYNNVLLINGSYYQATDLYTGGSAGRRLLQVPANLCYAFNTAGQATSLITAGVGLHLNSPHQHYDASQKLKYGAVSTYFTAGSALVTGFCASGTNAQKAATQFATKIANFLSNKFNILRQRLFPTPPAPPVPPPQPGPQPGPGVGGAGGLAGAAGGAVGAGAGASALGPLLVFTTAVNTIATLAIAYADLTQKAEADESTPDAPPVNLGCAAGTYYNTTTMFCTGCPDGTITPTPNLMQCSECGANTYVSRSHSFCQPCPASAPISSPGSNDIRDCHK